MVRVASFNVENLFSRPKAFNMPTWALGKPAVDACNEVNILFANEPYSSADKQRIKQLLVELDIYHIKNGAVRRKSSLSPKWAWLRKNRGGFDRQPEDKTKEVEITATGRSDWIGWVELAKEATDEQGTRLTARVIDDVGADIIGVVEAEDRPSLVRFNKELVNAPYRHVMLVDGNDERGIDVGLMTRTGFEIRSIRSNVDTADSVGTVFSRDCPEYEVGTPVGTTLYVLVNHFKSQSGGGGDKRRRQAAEVVRIVSRLVAEGKHVIVLGDLNEGPASDGTPAANLRSLFTGGGPLVDTYGLPHFDKGPKDGTYDSCGRTNRLDYILISHSLAPHFDKGGIFRKGLWGTRKTRPTAWDTYPDMADSSQQASDHAAVFVDLNI
ncbi:MAG: endonuclease/exonuclease/phosphatase family protein [Dehalococcoidia bacterium]